MAAIRQGREAVGPSPNAPRQKDQQKSPKPPQCRFHLTAAKATPVCILTARAVLKSTDSLEPGAVLF
jgi:hypothetical protein